MGVGSAEKGESGKGRRHWMARTAPKHQKPDFLMPTFDNTALKW